MLLLKNIQREVIECCLKISFILHLSKHSSFTRNGYLFTGHLNNASKEHEWRELRGFPEPAVFWNKLWNVNKRPRQKRFRFVIRTTLWLRLYCKDESWDKLRSPELIAWPYLLLISSAQGKEPQLYFTSHSRQTCYMCS